MQRIDTRPDEQFLNVCVYGKPGTGKTSIGVTAPNPLILLSERQGMVHIRAAAKRLGVPVPPVLLMTRHEDYRNVLRALNGPRDEPFRVMETYRDENQELRRRVVEELPEWPETVVLDSLTDACRLVVEEIRQQCPPKKGKDGLPTDGQRFWQVLGDRVKQLVLGFRDAPVHTLFLCLLDDRTTGEAPNEVRVVSPAMSMRRMPDEVAAAVNFIGVTYRTERREAGKPTAHVYGVMTNGPEHMTLKPYPPLRDREVPDFTRWLRVVFDGLQDAVPEPAPSIESPESVATEEEPAADGAASSDPDGAANTRHAPEKADKPLRRGKKAPAAAAEPEEAPHA